MKVISFGDNLKEKIAVCLGHFDGVHKAHAKLIGTARETADRDGSLVAVFTFDDGFSQFIKCSKSIFTLEERLSVLERLNVDVCIVAKSDETVFSLTMDGFLDRLTDTLRVNSVFCGKDYTFGYNGLGNTGYLRKYLEERNIRLCVVDDVFRGSQKISSSLIKRFMSEGDMKSVSEFLGFDYFCRGEVVHGENIGEKIGFPTLNTLFPTVKHALKTGVYKTYTDIDGKIYKSITNFGSAPTFNRENFVIETHVLDFSKKVYGKTVTVYFVEFMRDLKKFESIEALVNQLKEDKKIHD